MKTISAEQFKKTYGEETTTLFPTSETTQKSGYFERVGEQVGAGMSKVIQGVKQGQPLSKENSLGRLFLGGLKTGAGAVQTVFSPISAALEPAIKPTIGKAVEVASDKIADIPSVQNFAMSEAGQTTQEIVGGISDANEILGAFLVPKVTKGTTGAITRAGTKVADTAGDLTGRIKTLAPDGTGIIPSANQIIDSAVAKSFNLAKSDLKNIKLSTGNDVGTFLAQNKLLRNTVPETKQALSDFFQQNYNQVRTEIGNVTKVYDSLNIPRYRDALTLLKNQLEGVVGLEDDLAKVNQLLNKKTPVLNDIQSVKELLDEHSSLYKATGDVKAGVQSQGIANMRGEIKKFIEKEVKDNTGADIAGLNNNVSTSKGILKAVEARATSGIPTSALSPNDYGAFIGGSIVGGPLIGIGAVIAKKIAQNPATMLKVAQFFDSLSGAQKQAVQTALNNGDIPPALNTILE